ncbi:unnamed protein product [Rotaria sp. Silwood1]|nr:unnamed protein product [Rotaria sp. Silwood1]CAF1558125.1 unnamed protein product [Rotaria sp. Silwood1]CAF3672679.1 unnamed protein product [Rotaria sp. Silwood1]CAF4857484.1 unnamed protein product [Rotaria sp. Silwood1]CAF4940575.1 unnamed protein product [Rotaria sp. Silwood1]
MPEFPSPYEKVLPHNIKLDKTPEYHEKDDSYDRVLGSLVGLAIGDALGASVEFRPQQYLAANPVRKMEGGGTWGLEAGKWTDDTSMALCLASSLISQYCFNPYDQMVRYKWWHKYGYFSSTGHCFDIGQATRQSINEFSDRQKILKIYYRCRNEYEVDRLAFDSVERIKHFNLDCGDKDSAGNGALMRLAPVPLYYYRTPEKAIEYAARSAYLTHANKKAIDACRYYAALIIAALIQYTKQEILDNDFYSKHRSWFGDISLHDDILQISRGSYKKGGYEQGIRGKGYIVNALEAALWAFWSDNDSFEKGALAAVNLGDDTDTTAAIYCQLAGAYYGYKRIPKDWLEKLYARDLIISMGEWIHFEGSQIILKHSKDEHISPTMTSIDYNQSIEQKHQQNPYLSTTSSTNHLKDSTVNDKINNRKRNNSNQLINSDRSFSLESSTNTSNSLMTPSNQVHIGFSSLNSFTKNSQHDDITKKAHEYPFYRNTRYTDDQ